MTVKIIKLPSQVKNRLTNDLNTVDNQSFNLIPVICNFLGYILFSVIALLTMHWSLLLLILISVAVSLILPKIIEKPLQKATEKVSHQNRQYFKIDNIWI
ncbi:ABC transporter transmembrane domain-containing protein [uncultured Lactobacillus sp.]|uniref:ABC transporter transmembrane domain-containing protein n=1 Tax=uncultured Lactobacillus sp. TaxID=153152 RepID=UPI0025DDBB70|nr:ABC transporter transmembrane domain-containing protein [uncultured Lactobacillus sp.]